MLPLLTGLSLIPGPAAGQPPQTAVDGITRTEADLGTWDAVLVGRSPSGRVFSERGVEINTRGCDGTCIVTKLKGVLAPRNGGSRPWWQTYDGPAGPLDRRTGLHDTASLRNEVAPGEALSIATRAMPVRPTGTNPGPTLHTSVEYPAEGRRIVTIYRQLPDGTETMDLRITYTRRQ